MRYRRQRIEGGTYFFTVVSYGRRALFISDEVVGLFQKAVSDVQIWRPFNIEAEVILPDHLHALWSLPEKDLDYPGRWRLIKERFTRSYISKFGAPGRSDDLVRRREQAIWQRRYWEHAIRDHGDFARHVDYIHLNPVHHRLAGSPREWPYSTFTKWVEAGVYDANWGSDALPDLPEWARRHE